MEEPITSPPPPPRSRVSRSWSLCKEPDYKKRTESFRSYWTGGSFKRLKELEERLFREVAPGVVCRQEVYGTLGTIIVEPKNVDREVYASQPPLVMVHGYGMANLAWALCVEELVKKFRVFLVELHGHGRSHREPFPKDLGPLEAEEKMALFIEEWRKEIGLEEQFCLVGHSLGAMISWRYAAMFPNRLQHLILASPVGIPVGDLESIGIRMNRLPFMLRVFIKRWGKGTTPMDIVRSLGPVGVSMVRRVVRRRLSHYPENSALRQVDPEIIVEIVHHSWSLPRSGEVAMNQMLNPGAFAKQPLSQRLTTPELAHTCPHPSTPVSLIYGDPKFDWMTPSHGHRLVADLRNRDACAFTSCVELTEAGHNLALDNPEHFVSELIAAVDAAAAGGGGGQQQPLS